MRQVVNELYERMERDVKSILKCADCFGFWLADSRDFFKQVCSVPHLILYVKWDIFPYWPAKLMFVDDEVANVEFFDKNHSQADVPVSSCLLYSEKMPGRSSLSELKDGIAVSYLIFFLRIILFRIEMVFWESIDFF